MSRVTIVIPCYNDGAYLHEAIDSAQRQTHDDVEIVVVDDGSTDPATLDALARIGDGIQVVRQRNRGVPTARNAAIKASTGDYILPLDSDDLLAPDYASLAAAVLDADDRIGIVGGDIEYFGLRTGRERPGYQGVRSMLFENRLFTASVTRRADWARVGGYPDGLGFGEDWVYWLRILALGREVHLLPELVWHYRQRPGQMTRLLTPDVVSRTQVFAMRDQPALYTAHFDLVVDHLETKMEMLDAYRHRYGRFADLAARVRQRTGRARSGP